MPGLLDFSEVSLSPNTYVKWSKYNQIMDKQQEKDVIKGIVRNARESTGMNQRDFAAAIGVTQYLIYRWESGMSCPGATMLVRISRFLNSPIVIE